MVTKSNTCKRTKALVFFLSFFLSLLTGCISPSTSLEWPRPTRQARPWTRWWWMGSIVDQQSLTAEMEKYQKAGLGGLEITPIYGVKGQEDRFINYLTPKWMDMLVYTLSEAERLDMGIDMATGNGWPFGGKWVGSDDACRSITHKTYTVRAGQSLSEPVRYTQPAMVRTIGRRVSISELKEPIGSNEDLQAIAPEQIRFEKPLPLQVLMAYSDQGQTLNLTDKVNADGVLGWVAPAGNWTLYALFQGWHGKMVERAGPGGEGNVIDHFSQDALKNYLARFDQAFLGYDTSTLRAYFNDSYEVDDASGESNWTPRFFEQFQTRRGYDLRDHLPALFGNDSAEKNVRVLCDYRETISDLLLDEFTIPWQQWAAGKNAITRNQAHGSPANLLDLYAASGIPETEGSDRMGYKLASSAAHVTGKSLASSEAATWLNEHFTASLADVKTCVDQFFLGGINHICYHGTTFSPAEEQWPGRLFYASVHFGPTNSFWNDFSTLNQYVTRCQSFLQAGKPDNDVLIYYPIHDQWSRRGTSLLQHFSASLSGSAAQVGQAVLKAGYTFDFISDRQIQKVSFTGTTLSTGGASYKTIVIPPCRYIPLETLTRLVDLARRGATVVVIDAMPTDVPGWKGLDERRGQFKQTIAGINFVRINSSEMQIASVGQGWFLQGKNPDQLLDHIGIQPESIVAQGLQFVRRKHASGCYYFIVNANGRNAEPIDGWVPIRSSAQSVAMYEPMFGKTGLAALRTTEQGATEVYLQLDPGQSCILKTLDIPMAGPAFSYVKPAGPAHQIQGDWVVSFVEGGPELPASVEISQLGSWTNYGGQAVKNFSGTARYAIFFDKPDVHAETWQLDLGRVCHSAQVKLNGRDMGTLIGPNYRVSIPGQWIQDRNILDVRVSNLMGNRIADLDRRNVSWKKFYNVNFPARVSSNRGSDGLFNASRWAPQDSGLFGPVVLVPMEPVQ